MPATKRLSNELIEFEFPPLSDAFFELVKQQASYKMRPGSSSTKSWTIDSGRENYELQIGFLMDGFNVTLKNSPVVYTPNFAAHLVSIKHIDISMQPVLAESEKQFSLVVDLNIAKSVLYNELLRNDLTVHVGCSTCLGLKWVNETRLTCRLPVAASSSSSNMSDGIECSSKVFNSMLAHLNMNRLSLINLFVGNCELSKPLEDFELLNENLRIYLQTYSLNGVDHFGKVAAALAAQTTTTNSLLLDRLLNKEDSMVRLSLEDSGQSARSLLLIASIIATLLVMLIVFTIILVTVILKMKRKCKQLNANMPLGGKMAYSVGGLAAGGKRKGGKQLRLQLDKLQQHMDQMELGVRSKCAQLFQQLHHDYINELNHDMIYTIGLPVWNYKTYLFNVLFASDSAAISSGLIGVEGSSASSCSSSGASTTIKNQNGGMTCSSMSNSTTNTLLSATLQKQQLNSTMSVYATIKSNMMHFNGDQQASPASSGFSNNVVEAMQLFDQLLHNKHFLLTFIQVYEQQTQSQSPSSLKDRTRLASLLTVGLKDNLPYFYSILKLLLADLIAASFGAGGKRGKGLFGSNESLAEPLLANWLAMFMHDFQKDTQCATHLYRLVKVIKFYLEMGPCDQQTQQATHSLSEERLLKEALQYQTIYINVVNQCVTSGNSAASPNTSVQICRLIDLDTVQQAKEKILDYLYKANVTMKPAASQVDLELCLILLNNSVDMQTGNSLGKQQQQHTTTLITLKETEEELIGNCHDFNSAKRLLTLKDYNIQNGSFVNMCFKQNYVMQQQQQQQGNQHVYMSTLSINNEYQIYASTQQQQSRSGLNPPQPPPLSSVQTNRFHLVKPSGQSFSAGDCSSSSSASTSSDTHITDSSTGLANCLANKKQQERNKSKKYEKLLTVKSHDSAVTGTTITTSLLLNETAASQSGTLAPPSPLTRLLINKGTLQPFIDQFMEALFANTSNLPPVVQHLFEFFDQEAGKHSHLLTGKDKGLNAESLEQLTRHWKSNSYFVSYWANIIKSPELLLDCPKSPLIESSLGCIAQAFVDSCSSNSVDLGADLPPVNRLMFMREVPRYRQMIERFFGELQSYQPISDHELHFYLNEFAKFQQHSQQTQQLGATIVPQQHAAAHTEVNAVQVLLQLYEYYEKYEQPINASLGQQQCSILLPVHHRLVQIKELLMNTASNSNCAAQGATLNRGTPYSNQHLNINQIHQSYQQTLNQQSVNCYATTSDLMFAPAANLPFSSNQNSNFIFNPISHNGNNQFSN